MDVFNFSGSVEYNYGEKRRVSGYFVQEEDVVKGYVQETGTKYTPSAIKGAYDVETGKLILMKMSRPGGYTPEIWIFSNIFGEGWLSSYRECYGTFSAAAGIKDGKIEFVKLERESESIEAQDVMYEYLRLYTTSTDLSKKMVQDVSKYEWLFNHIKRFDGSAN